MKITTEQFAILERNKGKQFLLIEAGCHFSINPESWEGMLSSDMDECRTMQDFYNPGSLTNTDIFIIFVRII